MADLPAVRLTQTQRCSEFPAIVICFCVSIFGIQSHMKLQTAKQGKTRADTFLWPKRQCLQLLKNSLLPLSALSSVASVQKTVHYIWDLKKIEAAVTGFCHQFVTANFYSNQLAAT